MDRAYRGSDYVCSYYNSDVDIASPKQYLITTGAKKCMMTIRVRMLSNAKIELNTDVVLGTGGSVSPGTGLTVPARDRANTTTALTTIARDYILGSSGQSAGTTIATEYALANGTATFRFKLTASTIYGLINTSIADNNACSTTFEFDEV
jgi:hypothetical protein